MRGFDECLHSLSSTSSFWRFIPHKCIHTSSVPLHNILFTYTNFLEYLSGFLLQTDFYCVRHHFRLSFWISAVLSPISVRQHFAPFAPVFLSPNLHDLYRQRARRMPPDLCFDIHVRDRPECSGPRTPESQWLRKRPLWRHLYHFAGKFNFGSGFFMRGILFYFLTIGSKEYLAISVRTANLSSPVTDLRLWK